MTTTPPSNLPLSDSELGKKSEEFVKTFIRPNLISYFNTGLSAAHFRSLTAEGSHAWKYQRRSLGKPQSALCRLIARWHTLTLRAFWEGRQNRFVVVHIHNTGCYFCVSVVDKLFSISYGEESGAKDIFRAEFRMTPLTPEVHLCSISVIIGWDFGCGRTGGRNGGLRKGINGTPRGPCPPKDVVWQTQVHSICVSDTLCHTFNEAGMHVKTFKNLSRISSSPLGI